MVDFLKFLHKSRDINDWYQDKIHSITLQRNLFILVIFLSFIALAVSVTTLFAVTRAKTIEPFVIEISKQSGIATVVNPVTIKEYSANRSISNHFLVTYIKARELFDPNNYQYNYYTVLRLLSTSEVYSEFRYLIRISNQNSPFNLYSGVTSSALRVRSVQYLSDKSVQIRFSAEFKDSNRTMVKNKIVIINFDYQLLEMNDEERYTNPLGFVVTSYKIDDDNV